MATTADDVWRLLRELAEAQKETERRFQETDRRFQETDRQIQETNRRFQETNRQIQETNRRFQETDRQIQETDRQIQETDRQIQETDRRFQETDRRFQETDRLIQQVSQQIGKLGNRLGEFVEWQVRPAAVRLFQERGIAVHELSTDISIQRDGEGLEIDLLVVNSNEAVVIEVKSKLSQVDVDEHLQRLAKFKRLMPRYRDVKAMGAVAAMVVPAEIARYAYRRGLFVLAQSGDNVVILNDTAFEPKVW